MESNWEHYCFLPHVGEKKVTCLAPSNPSCKPMASKTEQQRHGHQYPSLLAKALASLGTRQGSSNVRHARGTHEGRFLLTGTEASLQWSFPWAQGCWKDTGREGSFFFLLHCPTLLSPKQGCDLSHLKPR